MLWHWARGLGSRVTFELLLIKGWCSQVSGSEQDLVTQAQRWNHAAPQQQTSKQKNTADLSLKWPKAKKISELSDCAQLTQRKVMSGELSSSHKLCTQKGGKKELDRWLWWLQEWNTCQLLIRFFFFAMFSHLHTQNPRLWDQRFTSQVVKKVSRSLPVGLSHTQLVICFGTGGAQRG